MTLPSVRPKTVKTHQSPSLAPSVPLLSTKHDKSFPSNERQLTDGTFDLPNPSQRWRRPEALATAPYNLGSRLLIQAPDPSVQLRS